MDLIVRGGTIQVKVLRWIARSIFLVAFLFGLFMLIGNALYDTTSSPYPRIGIFVGFFTMTMTTLIIAWKLEMLGRFLALFGCLGMFLTFFFTTGHNQILAAVVIPFPF